MIAPIEKRPDEVPPAVADEDEVDDAEDGEPETSAGGACPGTRWLNTHIDHCSDLTTYTRPRWRIRHIFRRGQEKEEKEKE